MGGGADPDMTVGGWHEVARTDDVPEREVRRTSVGRIELIVWRQPNGTITCQEAWCPHAWADLRGARVTDDGCIECPFHGWRFTPEGWHLRFYQPSGRRDRLRTFPARERDGVVLAWIHPFGEPPPEDDVP